MRRVLYTVLPLLLAVLTPVYGADFGPEFCATGAPWVLEANGAGALQDRTADGAAGPPAALALDVATYNLHSGLGSSHLFSRRRARVEDNLAEIARSLAAVGDRNGPDVVALNEVDFGSRRSGWVDQAQFIADELAALTGSAYQVVRGETWRRDLPGLEVRFGNAALIRLPVIATNVCLFDQIDRCGLVPPAQAAGVARPSVGLLGRILNEPRGAIRVSVELGGRVIDVIVTHLEAFDMRTREAQAELLLTRFVVPGRTTILLGDMNAVPAPLTRKRWLFSTDRTHAILATGSLADACVTFASRRQEKSLAEWATYPAGAPLWGLDWVLGSTDLAPQSVAVIGKAASDHRGLYVGYRFLSDEVEMQAAARWHDRVCEQLRAYDSSCTTGG